MANKQNKTDTSKKDTVKIKHIKKANMWVKTMIKEGKQSQEWSEERPHA